MRSKKFLLAAAGAVSLTGAVSGLAFAGAGGAGGNGGVGGVNIGVPIGGQGGTGATVTNTPTLTGGACNGTNAGGCATSANSRFGSQKTGGADGGSAGAVKNGNNKGGNGGGGGGNKEVRRRSTTTGGGLFGGL